MLSLAPLARGVTGLGPGVRLVLWVQGCTLACPGCITPEYFVARDQSRRAVDEVADEISAAAGEHDGLTISGGEPFQQARALSTLVGMVHRRTALDVMSYSGYSVDELVSGDDDQRRLLGQLDLLMDGRYDATAGSGMAWRGSNNQRLYALTPKGRAALERHPATAARRSLQIETSDEGVRVIGIQHRRDAARVQRQLEAHGLRLVRAR